MRYRRAFVPGGSFFFTLVTEKRRPLFRSADAVDTLRQAFRVVRSSRPYELDAIVVMPDHLHCIWSLPAGDHDFATRWRLIKTWFTKHCEPALRTHPDASRRGRREQAVWQHRYWEHMLRDEADYSRHVDYIHYNPVKHGYVGAALDWPFSSFGRYVEAGLYPAGWGSREMDFEGIGRE